MPTYDYVCTACGHEVEVVHPLHAQGPSACSLCGGQMKKSFAPPAVHFKGSGWARKEKGTGRASGRPKTTGSGEAASGEKASGEKSSEPAAEAKPAGDGD